MTDVHDDLRPDPLRILVVCTANRCRSPVAEVLLWRALVLAEVPAVVRSAGFLDPGHPVDATTLAVMAERGIDLGEHRSTRISQELVSTFDLILTMERRHARELVTMFGPDLPVFTIKHLAAIGAPIDRKSILELVAQREPDALAGHGGEGDVADPIGRPASAHRAMVTEVDALCRALSDKFRSVA